MGTEMISWRGEEIITDILREVVLEVMFLSANICPEKTASLVGIVKEIGALRRVSQTQGWTETLDQVQHRQKTLSVTEMSNSEIRSESDARFDRIVKARQEVPNLSEKLEKQACEAFTLLDEDGDGLIELPDLEDLLVCWGRVPLDEELLDIMCYSGEGVSETGMNYEGFLRYLSAQLVNTTDEEELRRCFQVFDSDPPTGMVNLTELRHYLKNTGMMLSDDELDFLFREEDYWMLEEKNYFEYEELIKKILDQPTCSSKFLGC